MIIQEVYRLDNLYLFDGRAFFVREENMAYVSSQGFEQ